MNDLAKLRQRALFKIAKNDALVSGQANAWLKFRTDLAKSSLPTTIFAIVKSSVFYVQTVEELAVALWVPAHVKIYTGDIVLGAIGELLSVVLFNFAAEPLQAAVKNQVLHTGSFAIGAVTEVALNFDDSFSNSNCLFASHKGHALGQRRKCLCSAWSHPHAATNRDVVTDDFAISNNSDVAQILGVNVDAIVLWQRDTNLKLTWQIGLAVDGFDLFGLAATFQSLFSCLFVANPKLVIRFGFRS